MIFDISGLDSDVVLFVGTMNADGFIDVLRIGRLFLSVLRKLLYIIRGF